MKTVIITGTSRGIGAVIAHTLLMNEPSYYVIGMSRTYTDQVGELEKRYSSYRHILIDLSDTTGIADAMKHIFDSCPPMHGLVCNAATVREGLLTDMCEQDISEVFNANVLSPMIMTRLVVKNMLLNNTKGSFVFISSICSLTGFSGLSVYGASKGAINSFVKSAAREWGTKGIRFNAIAPGLIDTDMTRNLSMIHKEKIIRRSSLKEPISADVVAETAAFMLSCKSASITGQVINVDAGLY